ncbi:MAG: lysophospholipid acyltransferase family protein [Deltaproteobacteria bacterium]|nr:lysophospholipid acyltransferase family protein [Deltaproteobacteria bacterium]MBI3016924.1 lysophospholipid acyltransferase family protein [Deltaproteobacteria bacterium]
MASLSTDGEIITQFLNTLRFKVVRGSQAKRGGPALEEMIPWVQNGYHGALAVDGSRGPKYVVKNGIIKLAQNTGLPIITITGSFKWKYVFSSWDQMYIPYPFSKGVIFLSDPIYVPKDITEEEFEHKRLEVENALTILKKKAEALIR